MPVHGFALSVTNDDGVVYENVTVISVTPKDLLITYLSKGRTCATSLPLKSLPLDVQQRYGYTESKEDAHNAGMAKKETANSAGLDQQVGQTQADTNSIPHVPHVFTSADTNKIPSATSPAPNIPLPKERQYGSEHPLYFRAVFGKEGTTSMLGVLDESKGTGTGYDTAYMDENMNNDFTDEQPKMFPSQQSEDGSSKLEPKFEFKGPLGENETASYTLEYLLAG